MRFSRCVLALASGLMLSVPAIALDETGSDLGEITVYAPQPNGTSLGGTTISKQDIRDFNRDALDTAINLATGTSISEVGARNETNVWIRGFDRWRVPLYQDGIPIYLPVDDRIDFGRFSTLDLGAIQISKGFASVIDGPGAMGGSINLVSRVVSRAVEAEARAGITLDSTGSYQGWTSDVFAGTRQATWYVQGAGSFTSQNHFRLADDFSPGTFQGAGDRTDSQRQDYKINLKAGFTPTEQADYAINFIDQIGRKGNPVVDSTVPTALLKTVRYWDWPSWDKQSLYWLSKNIVDARGSYFKTRLYYDKFYNQLDSYDQLAHTSQDTPKSFNSTYDDRAAGTSVEFSKTLPGGFDTIRAAAHLRWDEHNETEGTRNAPGAPYYQQPWESAKETTASLAFENIYHPTGAWDLIEGISYDYRHLIGDSQFLASGVVPPYGTTVSYPVANKHAWNYEIAAVYRYSDSGSVHASYADRSRFPTLFEMYSTRFGTFRNNPQLQPERSHYAQFGIVDTLRGTHVVANVFYARVVDEIIAAALGPTLQTNTNAGLERRYGYELEVSRDLFNATPVGSLKAGANYSHLTRIIVQGVGVVATDTPNGKFFTFVDYRPIDKLSIFPSLTIESKRMLQGAVDSTIYYQGGSFTSINAKGVYRFLPSATFEIGANNMTDRNYLIEDGYHAAGRQYFANVRVSF